MGKAWKHTGSNFFKATHRYMNPEAVDDSWYLDDWVTDLCLYRPINSTDRSPPDEIIEVDNEAEMRRILTGKPEVDLSAGIDVRCCKDGADFLSVGVLGADLRVISYSDPVYPSLEDTKRLRDYLSAYIEMKESG